MRYETHSPVGVMVYTDVTVSVNTPTGFVFGTTVLDAAVGCVGPPGAAVVWATLDCAWVPGGIDELARTVCGEVKMVTPPNVADWSGMFDEERKAGAIVVDGEPADVGGLAEAGVATTDGEVASGRTLPVEAGEESEVMIPEGIVVGGAEVEVIVAEVRVSNGAVVDGIDGGRIVGEEATALTVNETISVLDDVAVAVEGARTEEEGVAVGTMKL